MGEITHIGLDLHEETIAVATLRRGAVTCGHLGAFEFGIEVTNINTACAHLQEAGVEMLSPPQTVAIDSGEWKYAYFVDPDNLYVSLIEDRF
jgi:hypothetical protein